MKRLNTLAIALLALAVPVSAQQTSVASGGTGQGQAQGRGTTQAGSTAQAAQGRGFTRTGQAVNIRLDLSITDQTGAGQPMKKSITMLLADQSSGRVRSSGTVHQPVEQGAGQVFLPRYNVELNVDAQVALLEDSKMSAMITLEYTPGAAPVSGPETLRPSPLNQSVTVILQNGKPLVITQAADPLSDRKITVEVVATILR